MVDDCEDLRLVETGNGLRRLVVVNENNALALRAQQVIAAQTADDLIVFIENGIAFAAALQNLFAHVIYEIVQMEDLQRFRAANSADGDCVINQPRSTERIERR